MPTAGQTSSLELAPATRQDASHLAILVDMAGHGLPAWFWASSPARPAGTSILEFGRERARGDFGGFSWRNAYVARSAGMVAGMILGYRQPDDPGDAAEVPDIVRPLVELEAEAPGSWYVNALAVYPEFRGRGIGAALLEGALDRARSEGADTASLIVEDVNDAARRFYARLGFSERAERAYQRFPMGPEASRWILMVRKLN
jgi:ribosomal protein S18 acetylase RimI-like enzyme